MLPALTGAVLGIPGGIALFAAVGDSTTSPPLWQLLAVVAGTVLVVAGLTAVPARISARRPVAEVLRGPSSLEVRDWRCTIDRAGPGGDAMAVDYFIKFDGIKGESADAKHKDEIDIESWSWGETHAGTASSGGGGGPARSHAGLHFVMGLNWASVGLMKACATGQHIKMATLSARKAGKGQQDYLTFKFHDVLVSSFQTGGSEAVDYLPTDQVSSTSRSSRSSTSRRRRTAPWGRPSASGYDLKTNKTF